MSKALNQQFVENPKKFFRKNFIILPDNLCFFTDLGIINVDLNLYTEERAVKRRRFQGFTEIPVISVSKINSNDEVRIGPNNVPSIPIYWLPSELHQVTNIQLGDQADFFFTTTLNGCRVEIERSDNPEILHIAGEYSNNRQIELANRHFDAKRHRGIFYESKGGYSRADNAILYGIRNPRKNRWRFYYQGFDWVAPFNDQLIRSGISGRIVYKRLFNNKKI